MNNADTMKKLMTIVLMVCCSILCTQAQEIYKDHHFWDGYHLYTVKEIRMGKYFYMTTSQGHELTLEKVAGKTGEYKIIPSRQAEDCPFGAQYGWRVQHITQEGQSFLAVRKPNGDIMWVMDQTTENEKTCEYRQKMMMQEEPWNAVNSILLNQNYLANMVATNDLRLLRNKILAYHGYRFKSKDLQEYFGKMAWYKPVNDNSTIKLNIIEQTNIQLIKSEEAARAEVVGDEPWALTEDGVIEDIQVYFNDANKTLAEGSGLSPFDLDKKWYTTYWNKVYDAVNEKDGKAKQTEDCFFVDDNHWTAGLTVPVEAKNIKVEIQEDAYNPVAEATFTLVEKESGLKKDVIIELKCEGARYLINNWLEKSHDAQGSILSQMEKYIGK